jgi:hypothetical protein
MAIPIETFAYQFSAFARPVYCFILLFWTLDCARSSRRFNDITKHCKSSSNQPQNEILSQVTGANTLLYQLSTSPIVRLDPSATKSAEKREGVGRHRSLIYIFHLLR